MNKVLAIIILLHITSCKNEVKPDQSVKKEKKSIEEFAITKVQSYNFKQFETFLNKKDSKTYVINFWATWCKPCVEELPSFEKLNEAYKSQNVEVLLVSLDFPNQIEERLIPFIEKHKLKSKVILLDDPDQNTWIPKVSEEWSGAIPATLIYNKKSRKFYEQSFTYSELETELKKFN